MLADASLALRLPTQDLERARAWYAEKLGLEPLEARPGGYRYELAGTEFALYASEGASDGSFTQAGFYVDDIEAVVAGLRERGVVFLSDETVDVEGNYASKGSGERANWFTDSEGNLLGIAQLVS